MSDCVIISGTLEAKLRNKLFAYFHQRYVELVYVENETNNDNEISGHYEMRLYKNKEKTQSSLYTFIINPISMTCYINYLNSNKHQFTFVCSSQRTSMCFSAHTKYERDAWISVLEQLQWQYQPNTTKNGENQTQEISHSNTTNSRSEQLKVPDDAENDSDDDLYLNYNQYKTKNNENVSYIISLTQENTNNDNNYYYNYYNSNLWKENNGKNGHKNNQQCSCHNCHGQKFTILGLLNDEYKNNKNCNHIHIDSIDQLQSIKSPQYKPVESLPNIPPIQPIESC